MKEATLSVRHFFIKDKEIGFKAENTITVYATEMQSVFKPGAILKIDASALFTRLMESVHQADGFPDA